jgi:hypothetical protein
MIHVFPGLLEWRGFKLLVHAFGCHVPRTILRAAGEVLRATTAASVSGDRLFIFTNSCNSQFRAASITEVFRNEFGGLTRECPDTSAFGNFEVS